MLSQKQKEARAKSLIKAYLHDTDSYLEDIKERQDITWRSNNVAGELVNMRGLGHDLATKLADLL